MSGGFDSGGKGGSDGKGTKKGSGFLDGLKSFGASMLEGFLGGVGAQPATGPSGRPVVSHRDPVAERDRPQAAKQIQRSLKAWRDHGNETPGDASEEGATDGESAKTAQADPSALQADNEARGAANDPSESVKASDVKRLLRSASGGKVHLAGKDPLRGSKRDQMGTGPEAGAIHVGNAVQAGVTKPPQHHVLPQEQRAWFTARGVNVDAYCVNVDQAQHEAIHKMDWNGKLMAAMKEREGLKKGAKLSKGEIEEVARAVMAQFKIGGLPFVQYGSERP